METLYNSPKILMTFGLLSAFITFVQILLIFLPYWMHIDSVSTVGLFHTVSDGHKEVYETSCNENMGELECGYLKAFQVASVVTVMFGGFTTILYFLSPNYLNDMISFLSITGTAIQAAFGLMTYVLFLYFQENYYDDDGVNQEQPVTSTPDVHLMAPFYIWLSVNSIQWIMTFVGFYLIYQSGYKRKGVLNL